MQPKVDFNDISYAHTTVLSVFFSIDRDKDLLLHSRKYVVISLLSFVLFKFVVGNRQVIYLVSVFCFQLYNCNFAINKRDGIYFLFEVWNEQPIHVKNNDLIK